MVSDSAHMRHKAQQAETMSTQNIGSVGTFALKITLKELSLGWRDGLGMA